MPCNRLAAGIGLDAGRPAVRLVRRWARGRGRGSATLADAVMHDIDLILTLTDGLTAALILGYITQRLPLSPIVGYILAGVVVGPATPGFKADRAVAE